MQAAADKDIALNQITLIGVGLIGGSFVLDLKRRRLVQKVIGVDLDAGNLQRAIERRVIDEAHTQINADAVAGSDLVLIATPVATLPAICRQLAPMLPENALISDVGSTKQSALAAFRQHLPQHFARCVAAHPIAGSDRSGALAARFGLYEGKKLILCPHEAQQAAALERIAALWRQVGAQVHEMSAAEHDAVFAAVSHLPHLLAFAYVNQIAAQNNGGRCLNFAGSGFRDFTRIAASHPQMWKDIALENREGLAELLTAQQQQLAYLQQCLAQGDADALYAYFDRARQVRETWGRHND